MVGRRCELCERKFKSDQGLLQHFADKHPDASPPDDVLKREALRNKKRNSSTTRKSRQNKLLIVAAIVIVMIVIASVGVYFASPKLTTQSTTVGTTSDAIYGINTGNYAPEVQITLTNGTSTTLSKFYGQVTLLWFVTTWCPSCQQGEQMLNRQYYSELHSKGVDILVVELYNDLGQAGPSISQFANQYGGGTGKAGWFYGTSTQSATYTYDPSANLEVYYIISSTGVILTSGSPLVNNLPNVVSAA